MGRKRYIWSVEKKHKWHLSVRKARRLSSLYEQLQREDNKLRIREVVRI